MYWQCACIAFGQQVSSCGVVSRSEAYMQGFPGVFMESGAILARGVLNNWQQHTEHGEAAKYTFST